MARTPSWWHRPPGLMAQALAPLSCLYRCGRWVRQRVCRPYSPSVPVICVGNATAGGGGKTPSAIFVARLLQEQGKRVIFASRGYKGKIRRVTAVDVDAHDAADVGDEPLLLAQAAPTYVGANRLKTIKAAERLEPDAIIMDDGMQNPSVRKHVTILAESPAYAPKNDRLFPGGPYRERRAEAAACADCIFAMQYNDAALSVAEEEKEKTYALRVEAYADGLDKTLPCVAFAGLAEPQKFFDTLMHAGFNVTETCAFPDHHPYEERDVAALLEKAAAHEAMLITTEKDWVRLPKDRRRYVRFLPVSATMTHDRREAFARFLLEAIRRKES
ncbi:MAG: tetraacyldisaccharide 4'-kinase [Rickettsiales bacterium]